MLRFVIRKMLNKKWMLLALLVGNILLISIAAANPMYTETILQRALQKTFSEYIDEKNTYPMVVRIDNSTISTPVETLDAMTEYLKKEQDVFGIPLKELIMYNEGAITRADTNLDREDRTNNFCVCSMTNLQDHIKIVGGTGMSKGPDKDGIVDVVVSMSCMKEKSLLLGEILSFEKYPDANGQPMRFRVAGAFDVPDEADPYWLYSPSKYSYAIFVDEDYYRSVFMNADDKIKMKNSWYAFYDYTQMTTDQVEGILQETEEIKRETKIGFGMAATDYYVESLENFIRSEKQVRTTFLVLQVPVFFLLAVFIFMVAKQMLGMEEAEIAVLKSRGAGRGQILSVYLLQSVLMSVISLVISIPLAVLLVRVLASASGFMEFVRRQGLAVEIDRLTLLYAGIGALTSILTMTVPVFRYASTTIVHQKQKKRKLSDTPFWQKYFLDILLLGVSLYGLYSFNSQKEFLAQQVIDGQSMDPMLFLSASVFMLGAGLLALRILPYIVKLIFVIFKKAWSPALYTSFVRITRTRKQQGLIMVFLVMTIAIGVYNATAARTFNNNDENNVRYSIGADLVVQEVWEDNSRSFGFGETGDIVYKEPDYNHYKMIEGIESTTRVLRENKGTINLSKGSVDNIQIMGIETKSFGETAYFDESLLPEHWYEYLNTMSRSSQAVIMSSNMKQFGFRLGDRITLRCDNRKGSMNLTICGFVDYWPGYQPVVYKRNSDGIMREVDQYLIVTHLARCQKLWGITPYEVWMKTTDGDANGVYDFADEYDIQFTKFQDTAAELQKHQNDAVLQGTNGILTVGFIVALVLCITGFLIYWILSVRSREMQFGIFRAMGMSMREIITMLINEQIFISGAAVLAGAVTGMLTSYLFIPLIQIAYSKSDYSLPLVIIRDSGDMMKLALIVGGLIIGCMLILAWIVGRMKIAQALKLGED